MVKLNCTQPVQEYIDILCPHLLDFLKEECQGIEIDNEMLTETFQFVLVPPLTKKFIDGDTIIFDEEEILKIFQQLVGNVSLISLRRKGLVDTIENENGEEIVFLTKEGKNLSKSLKDDDDKEE